MIYSMTGFTRCECHHETGHYSWELRTVNHRFLEMTFRLPEGFREIEPELRDKVKKVLSRGKFECHLHFSPAESTHPEVVLHRGLLKQLLLAHTEVAAMLPSATPTDPVNIMRWPGVLAIGDISLEKVKTYLLQTFDDALIKLVQERQREGRATQEFIAQCLTGMQQHVKQIEVMLPQLIQQQRSKLMARIEQFKMDIELTRIEQEVVLLAQRADVAEEVDRLSTHIGEMQAALTAGGVLGRRLDFLLQEMQREANTLGSKSSDMQMTHIAVELKVLIEQIREQIQNVE